MKALILDGKVVDIAASEFEVAETMTWVDATDAAEIGGTWDGTNFGPEDTRTTEEKAADALAGLRLERNKKLKSLLKQLKNQQNEKYCSLLWL